MRLILTLLLSLVSFELILGTEYYSSTYDNMDVDMILKTDRLFNQYMACVLDKGPCTADGRSLRRILPEAMTTNCEKCNAKQKQIARKMCIYLKEQKPEIWTKIIEKYDPNKKHVTSFEEFVMGVEE